MSKQKWNVAVVLRITVEADTLAVASMELSSTLAALTSAFPESIRVEDVKALHRGVK